MDKIDSDTIVVLTSSGKEMEIEASEEIAPGAKVSSDAEGMAKNATDGDVILGYRRGRINVMENTYSENGRLYYEVTSTWLTTSKPK